MTRTTLAILFAASLIGFALSIYHRSTDGVVAFSAASILCWTLLDR